MRTEKVTLMTNPLRLLPRGYGTKGVDKEKLWAGERDRRLEPSEEGAIRKTLIKKEEGLLFDMALETAMRMREMFTLTVGVKLTLSNEQYSSTRRRMVQKRQVPISSVLFSVGTTTTDEVSFKVFSLIQFLVYQVPPDWSVRYVS